MPDQKFIPLASPDINEADIAAVTKVLRTGMLIQGKEVEKLENNVAEFLGVDHCIAVSNGTATMHLCLVAEGIGEGDEVIVPAFSYVATANVVELVGATPVFVDIDPLTFNIDVSKIEGAITSKTKAIIPVHEFGLAADISNIKIIAEKYNLIIIEDAACALGAKEENQFVGSFGTAGSFSLHPRKAISSGEGGLITTNNKALAQKLRILRNHGIDSSNGKMDFVMVGFNYRMTDFQAALVESQFQRLTDILTYKQTLAEVYFNEIKSASVQLPVVPLGKNHTWQTFHVVLDETINRDAAIATLKEQGIGTNYGAQCIPAQTFYANKYGYNFKELFPKAYKAFTNGLALPVYEKIGKEDIFRISQAINSLN
jgi:perosamine synthetase